MNLANILNTAIEYHQNGNFQEAENIYREVLKTNPDNLDALYLLGIISQQKGYLDDAVNFLNRALLIKPVFEIYKALAEVYYDKNDPDQAIILYKKAIEFDPEFTEGFYNLGVLFQKHGNFDEAISYYEKVTELKPDHLSVYNNMALIFSSQNKLIEAINCYQKAIYLDFADTSAYFNLGNLYIELNKFDEAQECFQKNIELNPEDAGAYYSLGVNYLLKKQYDKAFEALSKALDLNYDKDHTYFNLGNVYFERGEFEQALKYYNKTLELNPRYALAYNNIGIMHKIKNELDSAIKFYKKALEFEPNALQTRYNLGRACITNKNFEEGWKYFAARDELYENYKKGHESLLKKDWKNDLTGKTIYVNQSGGYGDAILFSRYLPLLREKGAKVITKYSNAVRKILDNNDPKIEIIDYSVPDNEISYDARICSLCLPCYFESDWETIPFQKGYLKADKQLVKDYEKKYFNNSLFKIGIVWNTGSKSDKDYEDRTLKLEYFYKLAEIKNIKLYSLQKGKGVEDLNNLPENLEIIDIGNSFKDFSDTAAAVENLDLVIGVDTSVTNLSGALGVKTWILLPYVADWKWFLNVKNTPWYESIRLFRQKEPANWHEVMESIYNELKVIIQARAKMVLQQNTF